MYLVKMLGFLKVTSNVINVVFSVLDSAEVQKVGMCWSSLLYVGYNSAILLVLYCSAYLQYCTIPIYGIIALYHMQYSTGSGMAEEGGGGEQEVQMVVEL